MTVTTYQPEAHGETVAAWWQVHTGRPFQPALLPPLGAVAVDDSGLVGACWLHFSVNVGVCFLENPVSRPGLSLKQARETFLLLLSALEQIAVTHDYGVMSCHTPAAIARTLKKAGFTFLEKPVFTGEKLLR